MKKISKREKARRRLIRLRQKTNPWFGWIKLGVIDD